MTVDRQKAAEQRTDWAEDRTVLALERTFTSWVGTGLGSIGVAIALKAVFGAFEPTWVAKLVATLFLIAAIFIFWSAERQAKRTVERLTTHNAEAQPSRNFTSLAIVFTIATIATGAVLWSL